MIEAHSLTRTYQPSNTHTHLSVLLTNIQTHTNLANTPRRRRPARAPIRLLHHRRLHNDIGGAPAGATAPAGRSCAPAVAPHCQSDGAGPSAPRFRTTAFECGPFPALATPLLTSSRPLRSVSPPPTPLLCRLRRAPSLRPLRLHSPSAGCTPVCPPPPGVEGCARWPSGASRPGPAPSAGQKLREHCAMITQAPMLGQLVNVRTDLSNPCECAI